jgi:hypothetical protein
MEASFDSCAMKVCFSVNQSIKSVLSLFQKKASCQLNQGRVISSARASKPTSVQAINHLKGVVGTAALKFWDAFVEIGSISRKSSTFCTMTTQDYLAIQSV